MSSYENAFEILVTRGTPIGAAALLERVEREIADVAQLVEPPRRRLSGLAVAAVVFGAVLALGGLWALGLRQGSDVTRAMDEFGVEWIELDNPDMMLMAVSAGPGGLVRASFAGAGSGLEFSPDGRSWSAVELPGLDRSAFVSAPFASNQSWLVIANDNDVASAWVSSDGRTWSSVVWPDGLDTTVGEIVPSGSGFLAVSRDVFGAGTTLWWSSDGVAWVETQVETPNDPSQASLWGTSAGVAWTPGSAVTGLSLPIHHTTDGTEWIEGSIALPADLSTPLVRWRLSVVEYVGEQWIAIGEVQRSGADPVVHVWTSPDAIEWTAHGSPEFGIVANKAASLFEHAVIDGRLVVAPSLVPVVVGDDGIVRGQGANTSTGKLWATENGSTWFKVLETEHEIAGLAGTVTDDAQPVGVWIPHLRPNLSQSAEVVETTMGISVPPQDLEQAGLDLQAEILADGVVTEDEYRQALEGWKTCMEKHGLIEVSFEINRRGGASRTYGSYDEFFVGDAEDALCDASYVSLVAEAANR